MVRAIIESFLGPAFVQVLRFYEANSLAINLLVVAYGLTMVAAWTNVVRIRRWLVATLLRTVLDDTEGETPATSLRLLRGAPIAWEDAVKQARYPLIARQGGLWPKRISVEHLQALIPERDLREEAHQMMTQYFQAQRG